MLDPRDGHEILALDLHAATAGETFSAGSRRELERAADGTLVVWDEDYDEGEQESCVGTGGDDCEPKRVIETRYVWDAKARELVDVDD